MIDTDAIFITHVLLHKTGEPYYCLWQLIFQFFSSVIAVDNQENYDCVMEVFQDNWILFHSQ